MTHRPANFTDVIDLFGSAERLALLIGEAGGTVRQWRHRGSIPSHAWRRVVTASASTDFQLTTDHLAELAEPLGGRRLKPSSEEAA